MNFTKKSLRLYAVTDRSWLHGETLYEQVEKALKGGVTLVQLREKELSEDYIIPTPFDKRVAKAVADAVAEAARKTGVARI